MKKRVHGDRTSGKRALAIVSVLLVLVLVALVAPSPVTDRGQCAGPVTVSEFRANDGKQVLYVDGDPFLGMAIQVRWDWFHELNGWSLDDLAPLFGHCADIGFNTVSCAVLWGKIEPTDDAWDFTTVDWVIDNARDAGLKVELLWFGMNVCGGVTCPPDNDQFPQWLKDDTGTYQRLIKDGNPYEGNHMNWGHLYTFCPRGTNLLAEEKEAVGALMEHVSVKCASDHDVIGVQIENEPVVRSPNPLYFPGAPVRCQCAGCNTEYTVGHASGTYDSEEHFSSVCLTRYMDELARVVKESSYKVITILNFMNGQPNDQDMETCLEESSYLDAVGIDLYTEDPADYLGQLDDMKTQSIPYGNAPNVGERYPRWTSQFMLASFARDCYRHNVYEIMSPPGADYTWLGIYSLLEDPDMIWRDEAYDVHDFLGLLSRDIQDIAEKRNGSQIVYFHCGEDLVESSCSETRDLMGTDIHYETNDFGLGMAIWDQDYIALLSTKDVVFDVYSTDYPLTVECGYFDANHTWVKEADAELEYKDSTGYGVNVGALECVRLLFKHPDPDPDPDPDGGRTEWNFAEGCTRAGFETWLCIQNPGGEEATVTVTYMFPDGSTEDKKYAVAPNSRYTVSVNEDVGPEKDVSTRVTSDQPVIVERPIYFDYAGLGGHPTWEGGHDSLGVPEAGIEWNFAEGCTRAGFETWLCIQNPGEEETTVTVIYMLSDGTTVDKSYAVAPNSRYTVSVNEDVGPERDVSTRVSCYDEVIVERPIYFDYAGLGGHETWEGGHNSLGALLEGIEWNFAEGCTRAGFETWLCIQNPGGKEATVTVTYMLSDGTTENREYTVAPNSRYTVSVNEDVGPEKDVSMRVTSDQPVIVERPMYFDYAGLGGHPTWEGGHNSLGALLTDTEWNFAEGCTRAGFETWLCIQNPGGEEATVTITYMLSDGTTENKEYTVDPNSRYTVSVNEDVGPEKDVSTRVTSDKPVIVERPIYFDYAGLGGHPTWQGGHTVVGY